MKTTVVLLLAVFVFVSLSAAEFPYETLSSDIDSVSFHFDCAKNSDCRDPGEQYCGDGQVYMQKCASNNICEITCYPIDVNDIDDEWPTGNVVTKPAAKSVGQQIEIYVYDTRNSKPLVWEVELYYGGNVGGTLNIMSVFKEQILEGATLVKATNTNREGKAYFTPDKPGQYTIKTLGRFISFIVADASGNKFECGDGICDTELGEDNYTCTEGCLPSEEPIAPPLEPECIPEGGSSGVYPGAADCCAGLAKISCSVPDSVGACPPGCVGSVVCSNCGDATCGPGENKCNCPQDCKTSEGTGNISNGGINPPPAPSGDNTMLIIIIVVIAAAAFFVLVLMKKLPLGTGAPSAPKENIDSLKAQKAEIEEKVKLAQAKFYKHELNEQSFTEITKDNQQKLIDIETKMKLLENAKAKKQAPAAPVSAPQPVKCPKCSTSNPAGSVFCVGCGERLK